MRLLNEVITIPENRDKAILFIVILSTFLLLFLYHNDQWYPIRYWLFLNGLILLFIPLLSLVLLKKTHLTLRIFSALFITLILIILILSSISPQFLRLLKKPFVLYPLYGGVSLLVICILVYGRVDIRIFGVSAGKVKFWIPILIVFLLFMIPLIFGVSKMPAFQKTYPILPLAKLGVKQFFIAELSLGLYFIFWEFFFRGYLLFALEKRTGFLIANCIQAIAFAFMHFGKPELEVYSALAGGFIIGWLCWRSKSFFPAFFIHWAIQVSMDLFAILK